MEILQNASNSTYIVNIESCHHLLSSCLALCTNIFLQLKYVLKRKKQNKRKKMIDACCDADFTNAVTECCWNVTHGRAPLSTQKIQQLKRHKALLRKLSNSSIPIEQRKIAIQRGSGFASLLPLLLGPIVAGISRLIKGK